MSGGKNAIALHSTRKAVVICFFMLLLAQDSVSDYHDRFQIYDQLPEDGTSEAAMNTVAHHSA
jgi:hypothetical protein